MANFTMSTILVVISIFSITVLAAPTEEKVEPASIVNYESEPVGADGTYSFSFVSSDGQRRQESGYLKVVEGFDEPILVVTGSYSYYGTDGIEYKYEYIADEFGYRVSTPVAVIPQLSPNAVLSLVG